MRLPLSEVWEKVTHLWDDIFFLILKACCFVDEMKWTVGLRWGLEAEYLNNAGRGWEYGEEAGEKSDFITFYAVTLFFLIFLQNSETHVPYLS